MGFKPQVRIHFQIMLLIVALNFSQFKFDLDEFIESLSNLSDPESQLIDEFIESLSNQMPEDGSTNWDLSPRYDVTPDESDDAGEMVQDSGADLPRVRNFN